MEVTAEKKSSEKVPTLLTVSQFIKKHPFISNGGLRFQIFNAKSNGLERAGAIVRMGKRVLIDEGRYFAWVDSLQEGKRTSTAQGA
jgi:hypothetical protein